MKKFRIPILLIFVPLAFLALLTSQSKAPPPAAGSTAGPQSKCPPTISQRISASDPRYGFYCGKGDRCPQGSPNCQPCDAIDKACQNHDVCWTQGACSGVSCNISNYLTLDARDRLPFNAGRLDKAEQAQLAQMRICNATLCSEVRNITSVTAEQNEARLMPETTFRCYPTLLPVIGGDWNQQSGPQVHLVQTGKVVKGSYGGGAGHSGLVGSITGEFDGVKFVGEYENKEGNITGKGKINWDFSTSYKNAAAQDKLDGSYQGITFPNQHGPWVITRD